MLLILPHYRHPACPLSIAWCVTLPCTIRRLGLNAVISPAFVPAFRGATGPACQPANQVARPCIGPQAVHARAGRRRSPAYPRFRASSAPHAFGRDPDQPAQFERRVRFGDSEQARSPVVAQTKMVGTRVRPRRNVRSVRSREEPRCFGSIEQLGDERGRNLAQPPDTLGRQLRKCAILSGTSRPPSSPSGAELSSVTVSSEQSWRHGARTLGPVAPR